MTDYTELGVTKVGETFSATIAVTINGNPQDLTDTGWTVSAQGRQTAESTTAIDFDINAADLAGSEVTLELTATDAADLVVGTYLVDVRIEDPGGKVYLSDTYELFVEAAITQPAVTP